MRLAYLKARVIPFNAEGVICEEFGSIVIDIVGPGRLYGATNSCNGFTVTDVQKDQYILIDNLLAQKSYVLLPQGVSKPAGLNDSVIPVTVPISAAYADTLDVLGFAELLNISSSFVAASPDVVTAHTSPCFNFTGGATSEYIFTSSAASTANKTIVFSASDLSLTPTQKMMWINYLAYFFGKQNQALSISSVINKNYQCVKDRVTAGVKEKYAIAWTQAEPTANQFTLKDDTYIKTLIQDAAAVPVAVNSAQESNFSNAASFHIALQGADMLIDTTPLSDGQSYTDWLNIMQFTQGLDIFLDKEAFIQNKNVFRTGGLVSASGYPDYPERYAARPDIALMDVVAMQYPTFQPSYNMTWIYNFAQSGPVRQMSQLTNYTCGNANAMLQGITACDNLNGDPFVPPSTQVAPTNDTETENSQSSAPQGLSAGSKAGIAVGVIAGVAAVAGGAYMFWRKRKTFSEPSHNFYKMDDI
ncbi:hypothetical protein INT43_000252 [Umbelopsis isabellina]|uniref:Periplasmic binding protein n=1 Tax=Mortierella isabellina TaxID=91625 RepID=A0A8H7PFB5_MORIS|nr:hypothetical protein INT43_000252 [Umbelopsis isabellina]